MDPHLLKEKPEFRQWYENLARGSEATAKERARILYRFLTHHNMTADGLAVLAKEDRRKVEDIPSDFMGKLNREGKSPRYIFTLRFEFLSRLFDGRDVRLDNVEEFRAEGRQGQNGQ